MKYKNIVFILLLILWGMLITPVALADVELELSPIIQVIKISYL